MSEADDAIACRSAEEDLRRRAAGVLLQPSPNRHFYPDGAPWYFSSGSGQWLYDGDGRPHLDLLMARGTSVLGYAHPDVAAAAIEHVGRGFLASLRHKSEIELAELIRERMPSIERLLFAKNGSDACTLAVRAARAYTGRDIVLSSGFHGFGDVFAASGVPGFPRHEREVLVPFNVNNHTQFGALVERHAHDLAAIIVDPMNRDPATPEFLGFLREVADRAGTVLVFDEVVTGFRVGLGGAQGRASVRPDLTCLGKVMGNGYPISALGGREDVLSALLGTSFSSTYQTDSMGFAVALACLRRVVADDVPSQLSRAGEAVRAAFHEAADRRGFSARAVGPPSRLEFVFADTDGTPRADTERAFLTGLADAGVVPTLAVFVSSAMGDAELDQARAAFDVGFACAASVRG